MEAFISFERVVKRFGAVTAVDHVSLDLARGEFFALLGPSGCGKTTLMRMLAGFEAPDAGDIRLEGASLLGVPPHRRPTNMMFQSYALFPHMDVAANIAFGLKQEGMPRAEIAARVSELLALVKLEALAKRRPEQLSGGQKQRVALARALAKRPKVLLLDEPLGALDRKLREATQYELKAIQSRLGITFLMVTHDQDEAMVMADRIGVMDRGKLVQIGRPRELYEQPKSRFVAEFLGDITIVPAKVRAREGGLARLETAVGELAIEADAARFPAGASAAFAIRPEKIELSRGEPALANRVSGTIVNSGYLGDLTLYQIMVPDAAGGSVLFRASRPNLERLSDEPPRQGETIWLGWDEGCGLLIEGEP